ncbi:hypothetical protein PRIPAC_93388 [Pristionchus pacificus]|uniref:G protein-coupled receptor n=1 Tax=Pristionchus pacificus TaxID=54126 RepID=A0A2A6BBM9_PRIPA|nr:hypothetical protein PRIPAC_93388 [Pristionchus pacificus]|eukprot:PDM63302.1 G protein-coupled receptor [Pristionchus pacificus]
MDTLHTWFVIVVVAFCLIGLVANVLLIGLILFRTPKMIEKYSKLVMCSAIFDLIGLVCMIFVVPKEVCYDKGDTTIVHFYGACVLMGEEACWTNFGILECIYTVTSCFLCFSYIFRLLVIKSRSPSYAVLIVVCCCIIIPHMVLAFGYYKMFEKGRYFVNNGLGRHTETFGKDVIGMFCYADYRDWLPFSVVHYTLISATIPFVSSIPLRSMVIRHLNRAQMNMSEASKNMHRMLIRALNIQLVVASCFFLAMIIFVINNYGDSQAHWPDYTSVPMATLQNVLAPIANIYVIMPYRRAFVSLLRCSTKIEATVMSSFHMSETETENE